MPRSTNVNAYPAHYLGFMTAILEKGSAQLGPADRTRLEALRFDLYSYRKAAHVSGIPGAVSWFTFKFKIVETPDGTMLIGENPDVDSLFRDFQVTTPAAHTPPPEEDDAMDSMIHRILNDKETD